MQTDWGGEYLSLNSFFYEIGIPIVFLALMHTNKMVLQKESIAIQLKSVSPF
jgi:hypothetical protein